MTGRRRGAPVKGQSSWNSGIFFRSLSRPRLKPMMNADDRARTVNNLLKKSFITASRPYFSENAEKVKSGGSGAENMSRVI